MKATLVVLIIAVVCASTIQARHCKRVQSSQVACEQRMVALEALTAKQATRIDKLERLLAEREAKLVPKWQEWGTIHTDWMGGE